MIKMDDLGVPRFLGNLHVAHLKSIQAIFEMGHALF